MLQNVKISFRQTCCNFGCLSMKQVKDILYPICTKYKCAFPHNFNNFIEDLNKDMVEIGHKLEIVNHSLINENYLVFVSTFENIALRQDAFFNETTRAYFGKIIELITRSSNYEINYLRVYELPKMLLGVKKHLTEVEINNLLGIWISQGYFITIEHNLYFGPRMLMEYENFFLTNFSEFFKTCPLCNKIVYWDTKCNKCKTKIHNICLRKFLRRNSNCPECKGPWEVPFSKSQKNESELFN